MPIQLLQKILKLKATMIYSIPKLKGKIATADPSNASSAFAQLTNMLVDQGGYEMNRLGTM